ncbi:2746_t:CDS:10 [Paraglomus occultum]|uniref:2746_t:CDS:1 n=1 Tax=Paraglomus occultum TaxID=144539 RepID=A0A9N8VZG9_9GLOM|nr:2746_t:CDS:10 [Paraglomus occultum]
MSDNASLSLPVSPSTSPPPQSLIHAIQPLPPPPGPLSPIRDDHKQLQVAEFLKDESLLELEQKEEKIANADGQIFGRMGEKSHLRTTSNISQLVDLTSRRNSESGNGNQSLLDRDHDQNPAVNQLSSDVQTNVGIAQENSSIEFTAIETTSNIKKKRRSQNGGRYMNLKVSDFERTGSGMQGLFEWTSPSLFTEIPQADQFTGILEKYIPPESRPQRDTSKGIDTDDEDALEKLIINNSWKAVANLAKDQIILSDPSEVELIIEFWHVRLLALTKLKHYKLAMTELTKLGDLQRAELNYEHPRWQGMFDEKKGSMVPFEMRVLAARLTGYQGNICDAIDGIFRLIFDCRKMVKEFSTLDTDEAKRELQTWQLREGRLMLIVVNYLLELKDYPAAISLMEKCLQSFPDDINLLTGLARLHLQSGNIVSAEELFNNVEILAKSSGSDSSNELVLMNSAFIAIVKRDWNAAKKILNQILAKNPENLVAANNHAVCELYLSNSDEAVKLLEDLVNRHPKSAGVCEPLLFNLCILYELRSDTSLQRKERLIAEVAKWAGDQFSVECFKLAVSLMCGIAFRLINQNDYDQSYSNIWVHLNKQNQRRGPDAHGQHTISIVSLRLDFVAYVLHLRGSNVTSQPIVDDLGNVLQWNGEIFDGIEVQPFANDTMSLCATLLSRNSIDNALGVLSNVEGPFAIIYWNDSTRQLWFGRDYFGRRSLLWHKPTSTDDQFMLTSVGTNFAPNDFFTEVPADGLYCLDVNSLFSTDSFSSAVTHYPWSNPPISTINNYIPTTSDYPHNGADAIPEIYPQMQQAIDRFLELLSDSVRLRVINIPHTVSPRVAVLFSGGIDCMCLAALADTYLPENEPIDLLNVGFENPRSVDAEGRKSRKVSEEKEKDIFKVPDRISGRQGVEELRRISPKRKWNFIEVDVSYEESCAHKEEIMELMHPSDTIMDLSIAMAFWFASRGKGHLVSEDGTRMIDYESKARVILIGIGADELLGGYSRHREAFKHGGWARLISEIQLDINRISTRNLGRDDRIISSHGKESRCPYLSFQLVTYLSSLPIHLKTDPHFPRGVGEKLLLRHAARRLGLFNASMLWKRAIQFGAKTAKMTYESRGERGNMKLVR